LGLAAIAADDYESVGGAGWAAFAVAIYGAAGAGAGAGIDALIRTNQVIYNSSATSAGNLAIVPFIQRARIGAAVAFRF
jgi:hypothetical protein